MKQSFLSVLSDSGVIRRYEWLGSVPKLNVGSFCGAVDIGDGSYIICIENVTPQDHGAAMEILKSSGFVSTVENAIGDNRYIGFEGQEATLYTSYTPGNRMLRIYAEPKGASVLPKAPQRPYETFEGYRPTVWQLTVDWKGSRANGGMSYVIRVADGRFVIIDGGYPTEKEGDDLVSFLQEHNTHDGKPVVAAWFITHPHEDHFGAMQAVSRRHADEIKVEAFYYNFPTNGTGYALSPIPRWMKVDMGRFEGAVRCDKVHTGTTVWVADAKFDILFTHEDLYPLVSNNQNDTSLVIRMTLGGQRVMFLSDIMETACKAMTAYLPQEEWRSDIVQFSHHGYEGATREVYDMIAAPTVLWPMNIYGWQRPDKSNVFERWKAFTGTRLQEMPNDYICNEAEYVKKIFVGGEGLIAITLPYVPQGDKLPDYVAIHDAIATVEEPENTK